MAGTQTDAHIPSLSLSLSLSHIHTHSHPRWREGEGACDYLVLAQRGPTADCLPSVWLRRCFVLCSEGSCAPGSLPGSPNLTHRWGISWVCLSTEQYSFEKNRTKDRAASPQPAVLFFLFFPGGAPAPRSQPPAGPRLPRAAAWFGCSLPVSSSTSLLGDLVFNFPDKEVHLLSNHKLTLCLPVARIKSGVLFLLLCVAKCGPVILTVAPSIKCRPALSYLPLPLACSFPSAHKEAHPPS